MEEELQQTEADKKKLEVDLLRAQLMQRQAQNEFNAGVERRYKQLQGSIRKGAIGDSNMNDSRYFYEYNMIRDDYKGALSGENPYKQKPKPKLIEATLLSVHDGDTGWFQVGNEKPFKVRFANVHAREVDNPVTGKKGEEGGAADKEFLLSKIPIGTTVGLASSGYDSYDRKVMSIYHGDGLNERLDVTMAKGGASQPADNFTSSELEWYKNNRNKINKGISGAIDFSLSGVYNIPKPNGVRPAIVPTVPVQQQPVNMPISLDTNLTTVADTSIPKKPKNNTSLRIKIPTPSGEPVIVPPPIFTAPTSMSGKPIIEPTVSVKKLPKNSSKQQPIDTLPINRIDSIPGSPIDSNSTYAYLPMDDEKEITFDSDFEVEFQKEKKGDKDFNQTNVVSSVKKGVLSALSGVKEAFAKANEVLTPYDDYRGVLAIYDENIKRHEKKTGEKLTREEYWEKVANKDAYTPFGLFFGKDKPGKDDEKVIEFFESLGFSSNKKTKSVVENQNRDINSNNVLNIIGNNASSAMKKFGGALKSMNKDIMMSREYEDALELYDRKKSAYENLNGVKLTREEYWDKVDGKDVFMFLGVDYSKNGQAKREKKVAEFFEWMGLSVNNTKETVSYNPNNNYNGPMARAKNDSEKYNPFDFNFGMGAAQDYFVNNRNYKVSQQVSKPVKEIIEENEPIPSYNPDKPFDVYDVNNIFDNMEYYAKMQNNINEKETYKIVDNIPLTKNDVFSEAKEQIKEINQKINENLKDIKNEVSNFDIKDFDLENDEHSYLLDFDYIYNQTTSQKNIVLNLNKAQNSNNKTRYQTEINHRDPRYWQTPMYMSVKRKKLMAEGIRLQKKYGAFRNNSTIDDKSNLPIEIQDYFKRLKEFNNLQESDMRSRNDLGVSIWIPTKYNIAKKKKALKSFFELSNESEQVAWYKSGNYGKMVLLKKYNLPWQWLDIDLNFFVTFKNNEKVLRDLPIQPNIY